MNVDAVGLATGVEGADARAYATGVYQTVGIEYSAFPVTGTASVVNAGLINVNANADANLGATTATAFSVTIDAHAGAIGIDQDVFAQNNALARVENNGGQIDASANAVANGGSQFASATAFATAINQNVFIFTADDADTNIASAVVINNGLIHAGAVASAFQALIGENTGTPGAFATAAADGINQNADLADGTSIIALFNNGAAGVLSVEAAGFASGVNATAGAYASGVEQTSITVPPLMRSRRCRMTASSTSWRTRLRLWIRCGYGDSGSGRHGLRQRRSVRHQPGCLGQRKRRCDREQCRRAERDRACGRECDRQHLHVHHHVGRRGAVYGHRQLRGWKRDRIRDRGGNRAGRVRGSHRDGKRRQQRHHQCACAGARFRSVV